MKKAVIETVIPVKIRDNTYMAPGIYSALVESETAVFAEFNGVLIRCENVKAGFAPERTEFKTLAIL